MQKHYFVYIMTNLGNTALYTGMTANIIRRVREHKRGAGGGFTCQYHVVKLVYFEVFSDANSAKAREKQIKAGSRRKKVALVETINPYWRDLYEGLPQVV